MVSPVSAAQGYQRWAPFYDHDPNPLLAREKRYLLPLLSNLRNKSALDLACGTGRWLETLIAHGCESAVGIDCSPAMLGVAKGKRAISSRLVLASGEQLPFHAGAFDLVICSFVLGHIRELDSMVFELARVTKPGAQVFVSDLHPLAYARGWRVGFREGRERVQIDTVSRTPEEVAYTFSSVGFEENLNTSLKLGEPERAIFIWAGKVGLFEEACDIPAVLANRFTRRAK